MAVSIRPDAVSGPIKRMIAEMSELGRDGPRRTDCRRKQTWSIAIPCLQNQKTIKLFKSAAFYADIGRRFTSMTRQAKESRIVDISVAQGPGVDDWLIYHLRSWNIAAFTDVQTRALQAGIADGQSMIVSAPTSAGKTLVGEIAVLTALRVGIRAIYLVSHKALADQKYQDFVHRFGERAPEPIASVGLNTGDRTEGDIDARLMVATYEKALGLVLAGQLKPANALVVADELQILGDPSRGADIEALCAVLRQRGLKQFIALTATVANPDDLAGWMSCALVHSTHRDVPLHQEIWYGNKVHRTSFGETEGQIVAESHIATHNVVSVVEELLRTKRGPVLVFTESRREAADYAESFGQNRPRVGDGIAIAEQLDLFSEPTESSEKLRQNAERRVAFHSADLTPQERQVIEAGFSESKFEVCFATSTLAAGVNFPFRSIVFPKLTYQWGGRGGTHIVRSDYRNMSGRAGRLGMHEDGFAILLPQNSVELTHANQLVLPENDSLQSQLIQLSLRKSLLTLVASRVASNLPEVMSFFENTLYWYQTLNRNPEKLAVLESDSKDAIAWLVENDLLTDIDGTLLITPLGNATALSGLLPSSAVSFATLLRALEPTLSRNFDEAINGLIYAICASDEFCAERPSRFLPFPGRAQSDSVGFWATQQLPIPLDRTATRLAKCAHAVSLYVDGTGERKIAHLTGVSSGAVHRLALDVAWVLDGLHKLSCVPDLRCSQAISNQISMLARRARWGAPAEALDVIRLAERHNVPGFGRQRAMALIAQGIGTLHQILDTAKDQLTHILRSDRRAQALLDAISRIVGHGANRLATTHAAAAKELGVESIVERCEKALGTDYEAAIVELLQVEQSWVVTVLDDGKRQNVPDILIKLADQEILLECKTCTKAPPLIKKEEAWAILQKAADYDPKMRRVTLGKPTFDETSKKKGAASHDITLIEHHAFIEGVLRVHAGSLQPSEFLTWLGTPGLSDIDRLDGKPTFS